MLAHFREHRMPWNATPEALEAAQIILTWYAELTLMREELTPAEKDEVQLAMTRRLDQQIWVDTHGVFAEMGGHMWVSFNYDEAGIPLDDYLEIFKDVLHPHVIETVRSLREDIDYYETVWTCRHYSGQTLSTRYLLRHPETLRIVETPVRMYARCAAGMMLAHYGLKSYHKSVDRLFKGMVEKRFTPPTPMLSSGGRIRQQMSSCFLAQIGIGNSGANTTDADSMGAIMDLLASLGKISASGGGIGFRADVRCRGQPIKGCGGISKGVCPMLVPFDSVAIYADQGGGSASVGGGRKGAFAYYFPVHCGDIFEILRMKSEVASSRVVLAKDEVRSICHLLNFGLWVSDIFMRRVLENKPWSLFSCDTAPGLEDLWGEEYEKLYLEHEKAGRAILVVPARTLWHEIIAVMIETGEPYIMFGDACNRFSPQTNLGTIRMSNLCVETVEYTSPGEVAVCNLSSISLPAFFKDGMFDFGAFGRQVRDIVIALNSTIFCTTYPKGVPEARISNLKRRPLAIGVQGFAQLLMLMELPWESAEAMELNRRIVQRQAYTAIRTSAEICGKYGKTEQASMFTPYEGFEGSWYQQGIFQWEVYAQHYPQFFSREHLDPELDWEGLRVLMKRGVCNSLFLGWMPTASTSDIMGNYASFEPVFSHIFMKRTAAGQLKVVNHLLIRKLAGLGLWNESVRELIIQNNGRIGNIPFIPQRVRDVFKTAYEIAPKVLADFALARVPFICQSQSDNIYFSNVGKERKLSEMISLVLIYKWERGAKTGAYYTRCDVRQQRENLASSASSIIAASPKEPRGEFCEPGCENCA